MERERNAEWWQGLAAVAEWLMQPLVEMVIHGSEQAGERLAEWDAPQQRN